MVADTVQQQMMMWSHSTREEMDAVFQLCRKDKWAAVLEYIKEKPWVAVTPMVMDNHIATTVLHQAITSKANTGVRADVIRTILKQTPKAACMKNGYGSLPLHVITQRNTKLDSKTKESLIFELVGAYKGALVEEGGVGKRTPLHIIFTDYISPRLTQMMIENGPTACFMKDKKGYLPAHVACSRHCSPEKLRMLLAVHPGSMHERTDKGDTLLSLAQSTATKSHPNYALIDELHRQANFSNSGGDAIAAEATTGSLITPSNAAGAGAATPAPATTSSGRRGASAADTTTPANAAAMPYHLRRHQRRHNELGEVLHAAVSTDPSDESSRGTRGRLGSDESSNKSWHHQLLPPPLANGNADYATRATAAAAVAEGGDRPRYRSQFATPPGARTAPKASRPARKRRKASAKAKVGKEGRGAAAVNSPNGAVPTGNGGVDDPAGLLLHFSRTNGSVSPSRRESGNVKEEGEELDRRHREEDEAEAVLQQQLQQNQQPPYQRQQLPYPRYRQYPQQPGGPPNNNTMVVAPPFDGRHHQQQQQQQQQLQYQQPHHQGQPYYAQHQHGHRHQYHPSMHLHHHQHHQAPSPQLQPVVLPFPSPPRNHNYNRSGYQSGHGLNHHNNHNHSNNGIPPSSAFNPNSYAEV